MSDTESMRSKILAALGDAPASGQPAPPAADPIDIVRRAYEAGRKDAAPPAAPPPPVPQPQRQPGDHPGGVVGPAPWDRVSDPFKWSTEDIAHLQALKGPREANRIIRQKGEQFARTMRIQTRNGR